jgi:hypothetical protein
MPQKIKQTKKELMAELWQSAYWRWQFLRRGEVYERAYHRFERKYVDWILSGFDPSWLAKESIRRSEDPRIPQRGSLVNEASEDLEKFRNDWGIDPTDPLSPYPPFLPGGAESTPRFVPELGIV